MTRDILLYGSIGQYNAMFFFDQIEKAMKDAVAVADLLVRINTEGGSPEYGWSIIAKVQEMVDVKLLGEAQVHSMGLFALCYVPVENVECLDVTRGVLHRAAYPEWIESNPSYFTDALAQNLSKTNKDLEKAFRARVDVEKLEALPQMKEKNLTLKDIFSMEGRAEVILTANDLKAIGVVSKINRITPTKKAQIEAMQVAFSKSISIEDFRIAAKSVATDPKIEPIKNKDMTLEEFKAAHPAIYAQIVSDAKKTGIAKEKKRVSAWLKFNKIDAEAVAKGISEGAEVDFEVLAEMQVKQLSGSGIAAIAADSEAADTDAPAAGKPKAEMPKVKSEKEKAAAKATADFMKEVDASLGVEEEEEPAAK